MKNPKDQQAGRATGADAQKPKPYSRPKLRVYGDVPSLTRAVAKISAVPDGGHGNMSKTH